MSTHVAAVFRSGRPGNIPPFSLTTRALPGTALRREPNQLRSQQGAIRVSIFDGAAALPTAQRARASARVH